MSRGSEIGKIVREWAKESGDDSVVEWDDDVWDDIEDYIGCLYIEAFEGLAIIKGEFYEIKPLDVTLAELKKCE